MQQAPSVTHLHYGKGIEFPAFANAALAALLVSPSGQIRNPQTVAPPRSPTAALFSNRKVFNRRLNFVVEAIVILNRGRSPIVFRQHFIACPDKIFVFSVESRRKNGEDLLGPTWLRPGLGGSLRFKA